MVQTYPQQTGTATVLPKPASGSGMMPSHAQSHSQSQQIVANAQAQRNNYHGMSGQTNYRGSAGPVQPYAFTATPNLGNNNNTGPWQNYGAFRTNSSPGSVPTVQTLDARPRYQSNPSGGVTQSASRDDSSLPSASRANSRQPSPHMPGGSGQPTFAQVAAAKASPDRYRRPVARHADSSPVVQQQQQQQHAPQTQGSAMPSGSGMANVVHLYNPRVAGSSGSRVPRSTASRPQSAYGSLMAGVAVDDMHVHRHTSEEEHKRFRRRSMASFDTADYPNPMTPQEFKQQQQRAEELAAVKRAKAANEKQQKGQKPVTRILPVPTVEKNHAPLHGSTTHARNGSSESLASSRSSNSRPSSVSYCHFSMPQAVCGALSNQGLPHALGFPSYDPC